ncbi:very short patch repair endonuclease [Thiolapillus sp.]
MTPSQRRRCMSRIRGKDTGPEMILRKALWSKGLRYRVHYKITGRPDIVFPGKHVAIFVDGCFWHGCPEHGTKPKTNANFWRAKITSNISRDQKVTDELTNAGWHVLRFWEHEINNNLDSIIRKISVAVS